MNAVTIQDILSKDLDNQTAASRIYVLAKRFLFVVKENLLMSRVLGNLIQQGKQGIFISRTERL
jgi:hypothetical protein